MNNLHELQMLIDCAKEAYDFSDKAYDLFGVHLSDHRVSEVFYAYESLVFKTLLAQREVSVELTEYEKECFDNIVYELATGRFQKDSFIKTPEDLLNNFLNITDEWANIIGLPDEANLI